MAESFIASQVQVDSNPNGRPMQRADIEFHAIDMAGPSFEARVFLNNPNAGIDTPLDSAKCDYENVLGFQRINVLTYR